MASKKKKDDKNFFEDINKKRKEVPGYNSLIKVIIGFSVILIILVLNYFVAPPITIVKKNEITIPEGAVTYKSLLDEKKLDNTCVGCISKAYPTDVEIDGIKSRVDGTIKGENIEGVIESVESTDKFIIKQDQFFIIKFDEEILTNTSYNLSVINVPKLIELLESNKSLKTIDNNVINYKYNLTINNIAYEVNTKVENKAITSIEVINENSKYTIVFK